MNTAKTKTMITKEGIPVIKQSTLAYICSLTGQGASHCNCEADIVQCPLCPAFLQACSYHNYLQFQYPDAYTAASNPPHTSQGVPEEDKNWGYRPEPGPTGLKWLGCNTGHPGLVTAHLDAPLPPISESARLPQPAQNRF